MTREELIDRMKAVWMLNDIQMNYWSEIRNFLDANKFFHHDLKAAINRVFDLLRKNTASQLWKDARKEDAGEVFDFTGKVQDELEKIVKAAFDMALNIEHRIIIWNYTDFGIGDVCWIKNDSGVFTEVKVIGARCTTDVTEAEEHTDFIVKVIALNKDGKPYGEPFWVDHTNIARHKKELK